MAIARIQDGQVVERREMSLDEIPEHKRSGWRTIVVEGSGVDEQIFVETNQVRIVRSDPAPTVSQLLAYAANKRWRAESGGITLNGAQIRTDETSQTKILGARVAAKEDAAYTLNWKTANGSFVTLDATTIIAIADAVRAHVQACFDKEMQLAAEINATPPTITTYAQIEGASWPT